ncbi:MAG: phosphotransferase [Bacteroidales bacterium]|nr:phosphotransferase [Bacteroidales bacterium]
MEAIKINLEDYVHSGEGANGESFFHRSDPSIMLKLYNEGAPVDIVIDELELSHKAYEAGIPVPKPGDLVTDGVRMGIRFQRIPGKVSFSRAVGDNPEKVEEYARRFARLCLRLHSVHLDKGQFAYVKEVDLKLLEANPYFTEEEKVKVAEFIRNAPDGDAPYHGDLQYSNAVIAEDGSEYFIDLGDFGCGHPYFDLGMVLLCCVYDDEEFIRKTFHMEKATALKFWEFFVKEYFGEDSDPAEIEKLLRPYAGLKVLIIERNAGFHFPQFHALLDGITG